MNPTTRRTMILMLASSLLFLTALSSEGLAGAAFPTSPVPLAYIGPGAGLGAIGALLAVLGAIVLCVAGLILYPLQLLRNRIGRRSSDGTEATSEAKPSASA